MRVLLWHGWLLEGSGSNVHTAKICQAWRAAGHHVLLLCQQLDPSRVAFVDAWGTVGPDGPSEVVETHLPPAPGRVTLLRPAIGDLLPVFVYDEYEGFRVRTFLELEDRELGAYLEANVLALRAAAAGHDPEVVVAGHAIPGPVVARRALGPGRYMAKIHGSDLEYAVKLQDRYAELAREGLEGATAVTGASRDVLARAVEVVPAIEGRVHVVPPGVEVELWQPLPRGRALAEAAGLVEADPETSRGRPSGADARVRELLTARDGAGLDALARTYDHTVPDPGAAARLAALGGREGVVIGYLGKLIPQKGVERFLEALAVLGPGVHGLVIGFGTFREWLAALVASLDAGDPDAHAWLGEASPMQLELVGSEVRGAAGLSDRVTFTGRLDHRYAPAAVAAMDVLVVPSILEEAFGMVAAEGAAAGALPVVARHSALAEVAEALETAAGRPGLLSFDPGPGATRRLVEHLERILALSPEDLAACRRAVRAHVSTEWVWPRAAERLLEVGRGD